MKNQKFIAPFDQDTLTNISRIAQEMENENPNTLLFIRSKQDTDRGTYDIYWIDDHYINHETPADFPKITDLTEIIIFSFDTSLHEILETGFNNDLLNFLMDTALSDGGDDDFAHMDSKLLKRIFALMIGDFIKMDYLDDRDKGLTKEEIFETIYRQFKKTLLNK